MKIQAWKQIQQVLRNSKEQSTYTTGRNKKADELYNTGCICLSSS
jgi:hypothetical protein